jgi:hypothetical protein
MKRLKIFFLWVPLALGSTCLVSSNPPKDKTAAGNGILLVYNGSMSGAVNIDIGIRVEIDSSVGVRYEVVFERGKTNVLSHMAIFYKYSDPNETFYYNFLTHKSHANKCCGSAGDGTNVKVVGQDVIGTYSCTHLQGINSSANETDDYWVSTQVPGYTRLTNLLNNLGPAASEMAISGTIFQWGGLVKMKHRFTDPQSGKFSNADIDLSEANSTTSFPASDFDVPSK